MTTTPYNIPHLVAPYEANFHPWFLRVIDFASHLAIDVDRYGVSRECYSAADWVVLPRPPQDLPVAPHPFDHTAYSEKTLSTHFNIWKVANDRFSTWSVAVSTLRQGILLSLDGPCLHTIQDANGSFVSATVLDILDRLRDKYGKATATSVTAARASLETVMGPTETIATLIQRQETAHRYLARSGLAVSPHDQYRLLADAVQTSSVFAMPLTIFLATNPRPAMQTFTKLATVLQEAEDNRVTPTAGAAGYALGASAPVPPSNPTPADKRLDRLETLMDKLMKQLTRPSGPTTRGGSTAGAGANVGPGVPNRYCWTHGTCHHDGLSCKNPGVGHQVAATAANKMGGRA